MVVAHRGRVLLALPPRLDRRRHLGLEPIDVRLQGGQLVELVGGERGGLGGLGALELVPQLPLARRRGEVLEKAGFSGMSGTPSSLMSSSSTASSSLTAVFCLSVLFSFSATELRPTRVRTMSGAGTSTPSFHMKPQGQPAAASGELLPQLGQILCFKVIPPGRRR